MTETVERFSFFELRYHEEEKVPFHPSIDMFGCLTTMRPICL